MIRWIEGFEVTRSNAGLARKYETSDTSFTFVAGRLNGFALRGSGFSTPRFIRTESLTSQQTWIVGFALRIPNAAASAAEAAIMRLMDVATEQCGLYIDDTSGGNFIIRFKVGATTMATTGLLFSDQWYYIELKVKINDNAVANGTYELRINEVVAFSGSSVTTGNAPPSNIANRVEWNAASAVQKPDLDDMYVCDTTGTSTDGNDFLGDQVVEGILPTAEGPVLTLSTFGVATHYLNVDDPSTAVPDDDATYNFSTTAGQKDFYGFGPLAFITANVKAVQVDMALRLTSSGSRSFHARYRNAAGTEAAGSTQTLTQTAYPIHRNQVWPRNPVTNAAWTVAEINTGFFGLQVD